jgi:hypothetical protein
MEMARRNELWRSTDRANEWEKEVQQTQFPPTGDEYERTARGLQALIAEGTPYKEARERAVWEIRGATTVKWMWRSWQGIAGYTTAEKDRWMLIRHIMETKEVPCPEFHRGLAEQQEIVRKWMACPVTKAKER